MKFEHIKDEVCPVCGAIAIIDSRPWQHTNGDWLESRKFACHMTIVYYPNYRDIKIDKSCSNSPEVIEQKKKLKSELEKLRKYISKLQISNDTKEYITDTFKYIL